MNIDSTLIIGTILEFNPLTQWAFPLGVCPLQVPIDCLAEMIYNFLPLNVMLGGSI